MELVVLGSGTLSPSAERTAPGHWVTAGDVRLLLDCGAGVLHRAAAFGVPWHTVTHVALTHFHVDHWGELPTLLFALKYGIEPSRTAPLALIGPRGLHVRLTLLAGALGDWVLDPGYPLTIREIEPGATIPLTTDTALEACKTPHTAESLAYAVREGNRRLVYTGDTAPSDALAAWARGCDLLLAECSLPEDRALDIHLTPVQAGALARAAAARRLVLTHFYPSVEGTDPAGQAARVFGGPVVAATDGQRFAIGT
jgi:ribonuclease BN (tRNA processing enzyme)